MQKISLKFNINIVLNVLLGSTIFTLLSMISMSLYGVLYSGELFSNLFNYISIVSMISAGVMTASFLLYFSLIQKTRLSYWLLVATSVLIVIFIVSNIASSYLYNNQPEGPNYTEISEEYNNLIKQNGKEEALSKLVAWLNSQENVKDAQIKTNEISGSNELFFSVTGLGVGTYDQSYPLDGLEDQGLYKDCVSSCPPEGTDNYEKCLSACDSSLGGE